MGTSWAVRLVPPPGLDRAVLQAAVEDELAQIVALFSHWDPRSELSRFNAAPAGFWQVSEPFWTFLDAAMNLADDTDGAVDPTLGALVDLWGFGPPGPRPLDPLGLGRTAPLEDEIAAALAVSGWGRLRLNRQARAVQQPGGLKLDFSGIAKGHAVDKVSDRLTALGARHHLVEIGGELRGAGVKPGGHPWWVDLQQAPGAPGPRTAAALFDMAVATSGDWVRRYDAQGQSFSHTIEGRTGRPVANGVASVTVLADTCLYADAMATALTVMGPVEGPAYATALGIAAAFVVRDGDELHETVSSAFAAMAAEGA
jgi:thiamine biosynthesis lipoprotein